MRTAGHAGVRKDIFTTGEVARACRVAPRTAAKWIDSGLLKGFRVPGGNDRRVSRKELERFMTDNELPTDGIEAANRLRILFVGSFAGKTDLFVDLMPEDASCLTAATTFEAGYQVIDFRPTHVVIDLGIGRIDSLGIASAIKSRSPGIRIVGFGVYEWAMCDVIDHVITGATPNATTILGILGKKGGK